MKERKINFDELLDFYSIQKYLTNNKLNSKSAIKRHSLKLFRHIENLGIIDKLDLFVKPNLNNYTTPKDFQNYIDTNNVESLNDLFNNHKSIYYKLVRKKFQSKVRFKKSLRTRLSSFNTIEDFQEYINNNNISSPKDLKNINKSLFYKMDNLKIRDKLVFPNKKTHNDLSQFKTITDFQNYIDQNNIKSAKYFLKKNNGLYQKAGLLNYSNKLIYPYRKKSIIEIDLEEFLSTKFKLEIQKTFDWLKNETSMSLDIFIEELSLAIEIQGDQHYIPIDYYGGNDGFNKQIERDKLKKKLCDDHGIILLYYSELENLSRDRKNIKNNIIPNYELGKVYTNKNELLNKLLEIKKISTV